MTLTRRHLIAAAPAFPSALRSLAQSGSSGSARWVFLGTDQGKGIYRCSWDANTGTLGAPALAAQTDRPDFFAAHPFLPVMYTVNAVGGAQAAVSAYAVDKASGTLTLINRLGTHGDGPCYVAVDRTGHAAYAANYTGGSVTAYRLDERGGLAETVGVFAYKQPEHGPVHDRQDAAHLHCTTLSPNNDFLVVCDLGDDVLLVFPVAPEQRAAILAPARFLARRGSGPRHVVFHPNGRWLYCMHELDCTVDLFDWSVTDRTPTLTLRAGSVVSTLAPGDNAAAKTGCELLMSEDGRFLTTCTRGADNIVVYRVDSQTGLLTEQQRLSCGGKVPRILAVDPSRRWLLSMNQGSNSITVFARNRANGRIDPGFRSVAADTPMFALWV